LDIDLSSLFIDDDSLSERPPETSPSLLISLYTVCGLLFHMGYLLRNSDVEDEEDDDDDDDGDMSLSAVYRDNLGT
ncbi:jg22543, partial [Pararge aegeria aegeria]